MYIRVTWECIVSDVTCNQARNGRDLSHPYDIIELEDETIGEGAAGAAVLALFAVQINRLLTACVSTILPIGGGRCGGERRWRILQALQALQGRLRLWTHGNRASRLCGKLNRLSLNDHCDADATTEIGQLPP